MNNANGGISTEKLGETKISLSFLPPAQDYSNKRKHSSSHKESLSRPPMSTENQSAFVFVHAKPTPLWNEGSLSFRLRSILMAFHHHDRGGTRKNFYGITSEIYRSHVYIVPTPNLNVCTTNGTN